MVRHSDMQRPCALVTGASGFTGHYVVRELELAGYKVVGLAQGGGSSALEATSVNLLDRKAVQDAVAAIAPQVVVHLAAISFVAHGDADELYRVNVVGTRYLLEALASLRQRPDVVVLASSANVYGNAEMELVTESVPPAPANDYAVSKLAMEYMAKLWMDELPIVVARPFNYTGVGQSEKFLLPKIVGHFRRREQSIELGNIDVFRDFSDVREIARAYAKLVASRPVGSVLNLCSAVGHSLEDVLDLMADIADYRIEVHINPAFVRTNEVRRLVGSNDALRRSIGYVPVTTLKETLAWMYTSRP